IRHLTGHTAPVNSLLFMPDGKTLISASANEVKFWNVQSGSEIPGPEIPKNVQSMSISRDGRSLAFVDGSNDLKFVVGDGKAGPKTFKAKTAGNLRSVLFSPDNDRIATAAFVPDPGSVGMQGEGNYLIKLWSKSSAAETRVFEGEANTLWTASVSPDGRKLAVSDAYSTIRIWNPDGQQVLRTVSIIRAGRPLMDYSADSELLAVGGWPGTTVIDTNTGEVVKRLDDAKPATFGNGLLFMPDSRSILTADEKILSIRDLKTGKITRSFLNRAGLASQPAPGTMSEPVVAIDATGKLIAESINGTTSLLDVKTGTEKPFTCGQSAVLRSIAFDTTGKRLVMASGTAAVRICDVATGNLIQELKIEPKQFFPKYVVFTPDSKFIAGQDIIGNVYLWDVSNGTQVRSFPGRGASALYSQARLAFSPDGKILFCAEGAAKINLWDVETGSKVATLITVGDNDWAVVTPEGLFDASDGAQALMQFVVSDPQTGYETISLNQLKSRYWVPGLLKKIFDREPLPSVGEFAVTLFPDVQIEQAKSDESSLKVDLKNRGGGIGRVEVRVNGSEFTPDARGATFDTHAADASLLIDIPKEKLRPGDNKIDVIAWNLEGDVQSRSRSIVLNVADNGLVSRGATLTGNKAGKPPSEIDYYAIVSGISNYGSDTLNLRYAAKDAEDMARALTVAARKYFCADEMAAKKPCTRVHIRLLSTETNKQAQFAGLPDVPDFQRLDPVKANYEKAFADVAGKAKADDVVTVYFSGHGTSITTDEAVRESSIADTYLYATREATTLDRAVLANETERASKTVSSLELAKWLSDIKADKKVLILDTCAAGAVQKDLIAQIRDVDALQTKSIERLRTRTGFYVLMGSAANAQSFEANEYRQGLLTYSLLEGMTIDGKLRDGRFLDVEKWFGGARDRVEELAKGIGGVQQPSYFRPCSDSGSACSDAQQTGSAGSFDIGRIDDDERKMIPLASRVPLILEPFLFEKTETNDIVDTEGLTDKFESALYEQSIVYARGTAAPINYINAKKAANGITPNGFYTVSGDQVTIEVSLSRDKKLLAKVKVTGTRADVINKLVQEILRVLPTTG
ncbi:MAG TPA: caspase family protein, partial [Pyrinomonadaceae bacterium]|nr:caspase family protein [Pyrinomonadaceae bacterium]